jgi:molybdate transport system permease protein
VYTYLQIPGADASAARLAVVAIVISLIALIASEWLARRASTRLHGV